MKICILTPRFPFPQYGGDVLRINEIARYLKGRGHKLILVSLSDDAVADVRAAKTLYDEVHYVKRNKWQSYANSLLYPLRRKPMQVGYYASKKYETMLHRVVAEEKPDLFISHLLRMAPYLERMGVQQHSIVEMTDALSRTYSMSLKASNGGLRKYIYHIEYRLIARYEQHVISNFPKTIVVSKNDETFLRSANPTGATSLKTYTNGVHCLDHLSDAFQPQRMCFIGNMRTMQNQDAVLYFVNDILPLIRKQIPTVKFYIVGSLPPPNIQRLASDDIIVTDFVDDLESEIQQAALVVAPVRVAAGIQNKVLQAMACGVPVVLSELLCAAIPHLEDGENCAVASSEEDFSAKCVKILSDRDYRNDLARKGYEMVRRHYSWDDKLDGYEIID